MEKRKKEELAATNHVWVLKISISWLSFCHLIDDEVLLWSGKSVEEPQVWQVDPQKKLCKDKNRPFPSFPLSLFQSKS